MTTYEIERVDVATLGRVVGIVGTAMAVIFGIPFLLFGTALLAGGPTTYALGIVFGASVGYVTGVATGLVYNAFAGTVGGLLIQLSEPIPGDDGPETRPRDGSA